MKIRQSNSGATAIEYALILALVAVMGMSVMRAVGTNLTGVFGTIANHLCLPSANRACSGG